MSKLTHAIAGFVFASLLMLTIVGVASASDRSGRPAQTSGLRKPTGEPVSTLININNIAGWIRNDGWSARVPSSGNSGVYYPRGTSTAIFQDGIVWGGNVNDGGSQVLRVGGQTYSIGTVGGRIISAGVAAQPTDPDVRIYRIRRDFKTADLKQDAAEFFEKGLSAVTDGDIATVRAQYETDWREWPASQGAPFYDVDGDGQYNPAFNADGTPKLRPGIGETYDPAKHADEPGIADADQVIWFVCNDLNPGKTNALYGSNPIGLELQVTLWGYNRTDPLANVYFKKFTFIYKGTATSIPGSTITDMYVGQWSDPDLGDYSDDFAGCDTTLSLVYVYNGDASDNEYAKFGLKPPAVGYDFLQGPIVPGAPTDSAVFGLKRVYGKRNLPMTAAFYFAAGGTYSDPPFTRQGTIQWYNLLRGLTPVDGTPFVHPRFPQLGPTKFWLDGDPVAGTGRLDGAVDQPSDRRIGACSGPFTMALGDTQEVVVGVVAGIAADYIGSVAVMKNNDIAVQNAYNDLFDLPKAPPAPKVAATALDREIILDWGSDDAGVRATELFDRKGYSFEGYNIYQLPSASAGLDQAIRLATFDIPGNGVRTIHDEVFDVTLGIIVTVVKQRGTDSGIQRRMLITEDRVRQRPLVNGQKYYFAVTAYGYNPSPTALTHALESSLQIIEVVPKTPDPGYRYYGAFGDTVSGVEHTTVSGGKSDGNVYVLISDPTKLTGHRYQVSFDTLPGKLPSWHLDDISVNPPERKLAHQTNQSGDEQYVSADGLVVKVTGAPNDVKDFLEVADANGPHPPSYAAFQFNSSGFPSSMFPGAVPGNGTDRPRPNAGGAQWGIHTGAAGIAGDFHYPRFVARVFRFDNFDRFVPYDFELRFTPTGGRAYLAFTSGNRVNVPFELWNIGIGTPDDPSDDYRMIPLIFDSDGNDAFNLTRTDHPISGGDNDPETDWIYWYEPTDKTPGQAGYNAWDTAPDPTHENFIGDEVMARIVLVNFNGGSVSSPNWPNNVNQLLPETGQIFRIVSTKPNRAFGDLFTFTAPPAPAFDAGTARADVTKINVFPNPYYGFNRAETSRNQRFVTFNHLPPRAEIRIFNLAGALVASFDETSPAPRQRNGQYQNWDLKNNNGLPVASGVYIAYINMPDLGVTKTLKLIVIQEQQFLDNF